MQPQRMCINCRKRADKHEFIRIVKNQDGTIAVDESGKMAGRGAYICKDPVCIEKTIKQRKLNRAFRGAVDDVVYDRLLNL